MISISTEPPDVRATLCVDRAAVASGPLVRGDGLPYVLRDGERITAQSEQRSGFRTVLGPDGHVARFESTHPDREVIAVTGCGNLGLNGGVRAWVGGRWLGVTGPEGGAIAVDEEGRGRRIDPGVAPDSGWTISGPDLVRDGRVAVSDAATFADPRHRVLFPYVATASGEPIDFGHDLLLADRTLYRDAASGRPVRLPTEDVDPDSLRAALAVKGYTHIDTPDVPGTCRIDDDALVIAFFPGLYPHHALAVDEQGRVTSWLVPGLSNRCGTSVDAIARHLVASGASDAILLDNGGDVGLWLARERRWQIRPAEPDRRDTWPISACLVYSSSR